MRRPKLHFAAARSPEARAARTALARRYGSVAAPRADVIVARGGFRSLSCVHQDLTADRLVERLPVRRAERTWSG